MKDLLESQKILLARRSEAALIQSELRIVEDELNGISHPVKEEPVKEEPVKEVKSDNLRDDIYAAG